MIKFNLEKSFFKQIVINIAFICFFIGSAYPQENQITSGTSQEPVMKSVFWNTVWGSTWGAVMGVSYHFFSDKAPFRESVVTSTTLGWVLGYGLGLYLVLNGLSFDERYLLKLPKPQFGPQPSASLWKEDNSKLHVLESSRKKPDLKWEATLFQFHF